MFESEPARVSPLPSTELRESYDEKLDRILEAATTIIAREGYARASMRAVAREAGASLAGMYHYFDGKEKMLFLIQFRTFSALVSNLREKLHGIDDPITQLRVMIRAHVGYFVGHMAALKVCSHELESLKGSAYDETRALRREYYELTRNIVRRVVEEQGAGGTVDIHAATMSLFGMLNWLYRWYQPSRGRSPASLANQFSDLFLQGLLGADSPGAEAQNSPTE